MRVYVIKLPKPLGVIVEFFTNLFAKKEAS